MSSVMKTPSISMANYLLTQAVEHWFVLESCGHEITPHHARSRRRVFICRRWQNPRLPR
ncbi:MAG: hypothetical protein MZU97_25495 [Bacillus subtilis]|nr:hypothetical protein [Bacillus subtilis]